MEEKEIFQNFEFKVTVKCVQMALLINCSFCDRYQTHEKYYAEINGTNLLLSQLVPVKPAAQMHVYPLIPSKQVPLLMHGLGEHSSISIKNKQQQQLQTNNLQYYHLKLSIANATKT